MDGVSKVWNLAAREELLTLPPAGLPAKGIAYSPNGRFLATGGDEGVVTLWDAMEGTQILTTTLGGIVHGVAFSPDGSQIATGSYDGNVRLWDAAPGHE